MSLVLLSAGRDAFISLGCGFLLGLYVLSFASLGCWVLPHVLYSLWLAGVVGVLALGFCFMETASLNGALASTGEVPAVFMPSLGMRCWETELALYVLEVRGWWHRQLAGLFTSAHDRRVRTDSHVTDSHVVSIVRTATTTTTALLSCSPSPPSLPPSQPP